MKTLILLLMSCTVLFSLTGKEITVTEGLWYISFPENSGEIKASVLIRTVLLKWYFRKELSSREKKIVLHIKKVQGKICRNQNFPGR